MYGIRAKTEYHRNVRRVTGIGVRLAARLNSGARLSHARCTCPRSRPTLPHDDFVDGLIVEFVGDADSDRGFGGGALERDGVFQLRRVGKARRRLPTPYFLLASFTASKNVSQQPAGTWSRRLPLQ